VGALIRLGQRHTKRRKTKRLAARGAHAAATRRSQPARASFAAGRRAGSARVGADAAPTPSTPYSPFPFFRNPAQTKHARAARPARGGGCRARETRQPACATAAAAQAGRRHASPRPAGAAKPGRVGCVVEQSLTQPALWGPPGRHAARVPRGAVSCSGGCGCGAAGAGGHRGAGERVLACRWLRCALALHVRTHAWAVGALRVRRVRAGGALTR
jgi:hypothetical protein